MLLKRIKLDANVFINFYAVYDVIKTKYHPIGMLVADAAFKRMKGDEKKAMWVVLRGLSRPLNVLYKSYLVNWVICSLDEMRGERFDVDLETRRVFIDALCVFLLYPSNVLSEGDKSMVNNQGGVDSKMLVGMKQRIVEFVSETRVFESFEKMVVFVIGVGLEGSEIGNQSDTAMKKLERIDYENEWFIEIIFGWLLSKNERKMNNPNIKVKLLNSLMKSQRASQKMPEAIKVVFEGLFGEHTNMRLQLTVLKFVLNVIENLQIENIAPILASGLEKFVFENAMNLAQNENLINLSFKCLSVLIDKRAGLYERQVEMVKRMFGLLRDSGNKNIVYSVQQCIVSLAKALKYFDEKEMKKFLFEQLNETKAICCGDELVDLQEEAYSCLYRAERMKIDFRELNEEIKEKRNLIKEKGWKVLFNFLERNVLAMVGVFNVPEDYLIVFKRVEMNDELMESILEREIVDEWIDWIYLNFSYSSCLFLLFLDFYCKGHKDLKLFSNYVKNGPFQLQRMLTFILSRNGIYPNEPLEKLVEIKLSNVREEEECGILMFHSFNLKREDFGNFMKIILKFLESGRIAVGCQSLENVIKMQSFNEELKEIECFKEIEELLMKMFKSGKEKNLEFVGRVLAFIYMRREEELMKEIESFKSEKSMAIQLIIGEMLSILIGKERSPQFNQWKVEVKVEVKVIKQLNYLIRLNENETRQIVKRNLTIWIVCVLEHLGDKLNEEKIEKIHEFLIQMLKEKEEITTQTSAKGMAVLFSVGNSILRNKMLNLLIKSLNDTNASEVNSLNELMTLVNGIENPELIYQFMNISSNYNSENLNKYFNPIFEKEKKKILPKLYRFNFDPSIKVRETMKKIFNSFNTKNLIQDCFNEILIECLTGMENFQWKVRESSCLALSDLLKGKRLNLINQDDLKKCWRNTFNCLDDLKESVRLAAISTCTTLGNLTLTDIGYDNGNAAVTSSNTFESHHTVEQVETTSPSTSNSPSTSSPSTSPSNTSNTLECTIPFLLNSGLSSSVDQVRSFSLKIILSICKSSSSTLKPFIIPLISKLLESLSELEPSIFNYASFHLNDLDQLRIQLTKQSPSLSAIESLIDQIDSNNDLLDNLIHLIKKTIGLPSKVGCARFIVLLFSKRQDLFSQSDCDKLLYAISGILNDKNSLLTSLYAESASFVFINASSKVQSTFINHLKKLYFEQSSFLFPYTLTEIHNRNSDCLKHHYSSILPISFFGSFDDDNDHWKTFNNHIPQKYVKEFVDFIEIIHSNDWKIKKQAGLTLAAFINKSEWKFIEPFSARLFGLLKEALQGKTWDGKEAILMAFTSLSVQMVLNGFPSDEAFQIHLREAGKKNLKYKNYSLLQLANFVDQIGIDKFEETFELFREVLETVVIRDEQDDKPILVSMMANAVKGIILILPSNAERQTPHVWLIHSAAIESLKKLFVRFSRFAPPREFLIVILDLINYSKYSSLKQAALELLGLIEQHFDHQIVVRRLVDISSTESDQIVKEMIKSFINK
ncbi:Translation activator GCN1-like protein [Rozella allomycis CSF55]|uniref:Translation activator GCN1-like protein n=1 Tax=Rozella allomycis (strain CSF55) TaxID=988480 RepID=A0A075B316_ROZAC|nr:Translation activator GCN1-like protein [Rozella allomycis CSF55]|eukprot:EPZ35366.1 Translation activator GCN1-like protein [Rozella allomycis CSF55]